MPGGLVTVYPGLAACRSGAQQLMLDKQQVLPHVEHAAGLASYSLCGLKQTPANSEVSPQERQWCRHADGSQTALKVYVHTRPDRAFPTQAD